MLSRIIERSSGASAVQELRLDCINPVPDIPASSSIADIPALHRRILELEKALPAAEAAAYARGRREAESEAQQRFSAAMQNTAERLAQSVRQLAETRPRLCREAEGDVLRLAMAIAQRILHRQLNIDSTALEGLVKVSLERLGRYDQVEVRLSPSLADPVRAILTKLSSKPIDVVPDANLQPGSLIFNTNRGQLNASIHSQLDEIERGLIDRLAGRPEERSAS